MKLTPPADYAHSPGARHLSPLIPIIRGSLLSLDAVEAVQPREEAALFVQIPLVSVQDAGSIFVAAGCLDSHAGKLFPVVLRHCVSSLDTEHNSSAIPVQLALDAHGLAKVEEDTNMSRRIIVMLPIEHCGTVIAIHLIDG